MYWLAKKQFVVFYEDEENNAIINIHEILTDKVSR